MTPAQRTAERTFYASRRRADLVRVLSPECRCAKCGQVFDVEDLLIDHINGRTWIVESCSLSVRVARYWREHEAGVPMRALCRRCSGQDGGLRYKKHGVERT